MFTSSFAPIRSNLLPAYAKQAVASHAPAASLPKFGESGHKIYDKFMFSPMESARQKAKLLISLLEKEQGIVMWDFKTDPTKSKTLIAYCEPKIRRVGENGGTASKRHWTSEDEIWVQNKLTELFKDEIDRGIFSEVQLNHEFPQTECCGRAALCQGCVPGNMIADTRRPKTDQWGRVIDYDQLLKAELLRKAEDTFLRLEQEGIHIWGIALFRPRKKTRGVPRLIALIDPAVNNYRPWFHDPRYNRPQHVQAVLENLFQDELAEKKIKSVSWVIRPKEQSSSYGTLMPDNFSKD